MNKLFVVAVLLCGTLSISGCASLVASGTARHSGNDARTRTEIQADAKITNRINAAYVNDPRIPAMDIRVRTFRGVVTLRGSVTSRSVVRRATAVAEATPGVKRVVGRLIVAPAR